MNITPNEIEKLAKLARLDFTENEKVKLAGQLQVITTYIEQLHELNVEQIAPTSHVLDIKNVFREDVVTASLSQDHALQNAPASRDGFFSVPRVINK
ncbi:MAG: Asp-tRNA(Asn)/Glu-tRNA(Gln) amidotransferase subunit GatC [Candidatus Zhuqueibacterota bacterium]